jgi:AcrR family transcriptional regulator
MGEGKGQKTRREILLKAVDLASAEGLEALTIGRLAAVLGMSKSGLFAHFGAKEELQLAVVETAREVFAREVLDAVGDADPGLARLLRLAESWLRYVEKGLFRGGCFFAAVSAEVDDRPGRVRDRVVDLTRRWVEMLETEAEVARDAGHLDLEPAQLAFEIHAFVQEANWAFQLHGEAEAFRRARLAMRRSIVAATVGEGRAIFDRLDGREGR